MAEIHIYTDGSCDPNPGPGGWAALIISNEEQKMISGSCAEATNNRMELLAALEAIRTQKNGSRIVVHTDSQYLKKGITEWMDDWKLRNWKRKGGKLANVDLWKALSKEIERFELYWVWVRGHAGDRFNEKVDREARIRAFQAKKKG